MRDVDVEARLTRLEDVEAIRDLVARYGFAIDDRDLDGVKVLFATEGSLQTASGPSKGKGVDAVGDYFAGRFAVLGPTHHFTHDHVIDFDPADPAIAHGRVAAHAEVWRDGRPMLTALRYLDTYVKKPEGWRFLSRTQAYLYFVDVRQYPEALGAKLRVRTGETEADWKPADWPAGL
ncbi:nuclear transport factor 2 family protein [Dactylosporangium sp. NPDC005572]|uniref:nuclear transport factor 2 family protein n=1 Tax=Dactylosporangium sp. NPDC005572 TaxID=3156889 RepID=UPI0033BD082B